MPSTFGSGFRSVLGLAALSFLLAARGEAQPSEAFDRLIKLPTGVGDASFFGR
jgi:hypothetical protein